MRTLSFFFFITAALTLSLALAADIDDELLSLFASSEEEEEGNYDNEELSDQYVEETGGSSVNDELSSLFGSSEEEEEEEHSDDDDEEDVENKNDHDEDYFQGEGEEAKVGQFGSPEEEKEDMEETEEKKEEEKEEKKENENEAGTRVVRITVLKKDRFEARKCMTSCIAEGEVHRDKRAAGNRTRKAAASAEAVKAAASSSYEEDSYEEYEEGDDDYEDSSEEDSDSSSKSDSDSTDESKEGESEVGGMLDTPECRRDQECTDRNSVCTKKGRCREEGDGRTDILEECEHDSDCKKKLLCMLGRCDSPGRKRNYCKIDEHCRSDLYCLQKKSYCWPKKEPGSSCKAHIHCLDSFCLSEQRSSSIHVQQGFNNRKYCATVDARAGEACDPRKIHCAHGLDCVVPQGLDYDYAGNNAYEGDDEDYGNKGHRKVFRKISARGASGDYYKAGKKVFFAKRKSKNRGKKARGGKKHNVGKRDVRKVRDRGNRGLLLGQQQQRRRKNFPSTGYVCVPLPLRRDSNLGCKSNGDCPCGEVCKDKKFCKLAKCKSLEPDCQAKHQLPYRYECRNDICVPPRSFFNELFSGGKISTVDDDFNA